MLVLVISAICRQNYLMQIATQLTSSPETPIRSTVWSRTREQYAAMRPEQQRDALIASACTIGGVALNLVNTFYIKPRLQHHPKPIVKLVPAALRAASCFFDKADGWWAKRSRIEDENGNVVDPGAVTDFGKIADPFADKISNAANETDSFLNNRLGLGSTVLRIGLDGYKQYLRGKTAKNTNGEVSVAANKLGQTAQAVRAAGNVYAALSTKPSHVNTVVQFASTALLFVSSAKTIREMDRKTDAWQAAGKNYQQTPESRI